jgi:hypothetical protein
LIQRWRAKKTSLADCQTIFLIGKNCQFNDPFCKWHPAAHDLIFDHPPEHSVLGIDDFRDEKRMKKKSKRYANNQPN